MTWDEEAALWRAHLLLGGRRRAVGSSGSATACARAYDRAALSLHGSAAATNFPPADYPEFARLQLPQYAWPVSHILGVVSTPL